MASNGEDEAEAPPQPVDSVSQAFKFLSVPKLTGKDGTIPADYLHQSRRVLLERRRRQKNKHNVRRRDGLSSGANVKGVDSYPPPQSFWAQMEDYFREVTVDDLEATLPLSDGELATLLTIPRRGVHYKIQWAQDDKSADDVAMMAQKTAASRKVRKKLLIANPSQKISKLNKTVAGTVLKAKVSHPAVDSNDVCDVCYAGKYSDLDEMLVCAVCKVRVHTECHGGTHRLDEPWNCVRCNLAPKPVQCALCPVEGGILKPVASGVGFAHLFCSQWFSETFVEDKAKLEPICGVDQLGENRMLCSSRRQKLTCSVCRKDGGPCLKCSHGQCAVPFHPICARNQKLYMEASTYAESDEIQLSAYCAKHTPWKLAREETSDRDVQSAPAASSPKPSKLNMKTKRTTPSFEPGVTEEAEAAAGSDSGHPAKSYVFLNSLSEQGLNPYSSNFEEIKTAVEALTIPHLNSCIKRVMASMGVTQLSFAQQIGMPQSSLSNWLQGREKRHSEEHNNRIRRFFLAKIAEEKKKEAEGVPASAPAAGDTKPRAEDKKDEVKKPEAPPSVDRVTRGRRTPHLPSPATPVTVPVSTVDESGVNLVQALPSIGELARIPVPPGKIHPYIMHQLNSGILGEENPFAHLPVSTSESDLHSIVKSQTWEEDNEASDRDRPSDALASNVQKYGDSQKKKDKLVGSESADVWAQDVDWRIIPEGVSPEWDESRNQFRKAREMGLFDINPKDEIERKLLKLQKELLEVTGKLRGMMGGLMEKMVPDMSAMRQAQKHKEQQMALMAAYMAGEREKRKQSRKERKKKEAEQQMAAASAALASSPRPSSLSGQVQNISQRGRVSHSRHLDSDRDTGLQAGPRIRRGTSSLLASSSAATPITPTATAVRGRGRGRPPITPPATSLPAGLSLSLEQGASQRVTGSVRKRGGRGRALTLAGHGPGITGAASVASQRINTTLLTPSVSARSGSGRGRGVNGAQWPLPGSVHEPRGVGRPPRMPVLTPQPYDCMEVEGSASASLSAVLCSVCGDGSSVAPNQLVLCARCRVTVHQDCYGISAFPLRPWFCQACRHRSTRAASSPVAGAGRGAGSFMPVEAAEHDASGLLRPGVQCYICPGLAGAFKQGKSTLGLWAHVFCALWTPQTSVEPGEGGSVLGLEDVQCTAAVCVLCHRSEGACLTCSFGQCGASFHAICARNKGFLMTGKVVQSSGQAVRLELKAYCDKHSEKQRLKVEARTAQDSEGMDSVKSIRMGLERLRLVCGRVTKRERLKVELVLVGHGTQLLKLIEAGDQFASIPEALLPYMEGAGQGMKVVEEKRAGVDGEWREHH